MSQLFAWDGQSIGVSASASVLPMNTQDLSPSGWTGWISLQSEGLSRVFSNTTVQKHQFFNTQLSSKSNSHIQTWPLEISILLFSHSVMSDSLWPHGINMPGLPIPYHLPKFAQVHVYCIWYHPAISFSDAVFSFRLQSIIASGTFLMSFIRWPKCWSFNFSISPSNEYSVLISLKTDWFDLPAVQGALRSLLQHHNSKASTLWLTAFLMVQLSQMYVTTGKTISVHKWSFIVETFHMV